MSVLPSLSKYPVLMVSEDTPRVGQSDAGGLRADAGDPTELIERIRAAAASDPDVRRAVGELVAELRRMVGNVTVDPYSGLTRSCEQ
ncbi:MAG: hypothetical protein DIU79_09380 [Actinobacteria bacterium]|nr:MAG: hypothetical protein DIU79_09380 [Actinomycetota bacterium]